MIGGITVLVLVTWHVARVLSVSVRRNEGRVFTTEEVVVACSFQVLLNTVTSSKKCQKIIKILEEEKSLHYMFVALREQGASWMTVMVHQLWKSTSVAEHWQSWVVGSGWPLWRCGLSVV